MTSLAPHKHLRLISTTGGADAAREFPVRFTSRADPLAWLRKPANSFRWVGPGSVRIDERGLQVTARRLTLLGLRRTRRVIHAAEIRDASREGAAVRINLRGAAGDAWFQFWAEDAAAAAALIALLPTNRTVEFDDALQSARAGGAARAPASWLLAGIAGLVLALAWMATHQFVSPPLRPLSQPRTTPALAAAARADGLQRAVTDASEVEALAAWGDLDKYGKRFEGLTVQFATAFSALLAGTLSQEDFANGLERWLQPQWRSLARGLPAAGPVSLRTLADEQLRAVIVNWQRALELYARGLRLHDPLEVNRAFVFMRAAEGHEAQARALLGELQRRRGDAPGRADSSAH
jgi:hypothetical protein